MKLTKKHRIYGGALLACLGILAADRAFFAPASASAEPLSTAGAVPAAAAMSAGAAGASDAAPTPDLIDLQASLARRLDAAAAAEALDVATIPSAFQIPASWTPVAAEPSAEAEPVAEVETAPADPVAEFVAAHRLTAVMAGAARGYAIINGELLYVGQQMDGFTLIEVEHRAAVLASGALSVRLTLPD